MPPKILATNICQYSNDVHCITAAMMTMILAQMIDHFLPILSPHTKAATAPKAHPMS